MAKGSSFTDYTEDELIEQPTIRLFGDIGWETANCFQEFDLPGGSPLGRETPLRLVLVSKLRPALQKLNPALPSEAISLAIEEINRDRSKMSFLGQSGGLSSPKRWGKGHLQKRPGRGDDRDGQGDRLGRTLQQRFLPGLPVLGIRGNV